MTLENVKQEILNRTKKDNQNILEEAKSEAKKIKDLGKKEISDYNESLKQNEEKIIKDYKVIKEASLDFGFRRNKFEVESNLMDMTKKEAYNSLINLPSSRRSEHIQKLIKSASEQINIARVYCSRADMDLIKGYETVEEKIAGGIIAENKEGDERIDLSYDSLIEEVFSDNVSEIRKRLL